HHVNRERTGSRFRNAAAKQRGTAPSELRGRSGSEARNRMTDSVCDVLLRAPEAVPQQEGGAAVAIRVAPGDVPGKVTNWARQAAQIARGRRLDREEAYPHRWVLTLLDGNALEPDISCRSRRNRRPPSKASDGATRRRAVQ